MNSYRYRVTVEALSDAKGQPVVEEAGVAHTLTFEAANHDDLLAIVRRSQAKEMMAPDDAAAMVIGLKLFGEVVLAQRKDPMFAEVRPALSAFIKQLKAR